MPRFQPRSQIGDLQEAADHCDTRTHACTLSVLRGGQGCTHTQPGEKELQEESAGGTRLSGSHVSGRASLAEHRVGRDFRRGAEAAAAVAE